MASKQGPPKIAATDRKVPSRKELREAIESAGYPLELRVAGRLAAAGFTPISSWIWWESGRQKEREVDVVAQQAFWEGDMAVEIHVLVECKEFTDGMVVFEPPDSDAKFLTRSSQSHVWGHPAHVRTKPGSIASIPLQDAFGWGTKRWASADVVGYQYAVLHRPDPGKQKDRWRIDHQETNESITGLCGGLLEYQKSYGLVVPSDKMAYMNFASLLVVVEGPIYCYRAASKGVRSSLRPIDRATYHRRGYNAAGTWGDYRIDFVRERAVPGALSALEVDGKGMLASAIKREALIKESMRSTFQKNGA